MVVLKCSCILGSGNLRDFDGIFMFVDCVHLLL